MVRPTWGSSFLQKLRLLRLQARHVLVSSMLVCILLLPTIRRSMRSWPLPCNFSSEINEAFLPEPVGAPGSSIDLAELVQETIDQYAYFGSSRDAQSDYRREAFDDMLWRAEEGTDVHRNSYLKVFFEKVVSDFPFADYMYLPSREVARVPFKQQHFLDMQDPDPLPIVDTPTYRMKSASDFLSYIDRFLFHAKPLNQVTSDHRRPVILTKRILSSYSPKSQSWKHKPTTGYWRQRSFSKAFSWYFVMILIPLFSHTLFSGTVPTSFHSARPATTKEACRGINSLLATMPCLAWSYTAKHRLRASACLFGVPKRAEISSSYTLPVSVWVPDAKWSEKVLDLSRMYLPHRTHYMGRPDIGHLDLDRNWTADNGECSSASLSTFVLYQGLSGKINRRNPGLRSSRPPTCINRQTVQTGCTYAAWDSLKCALRHFISSFAWRNAYADACHIWTSFLSYCLSHQVDFIMGGGDLFAQRNFKQDRHSDFRSCILIDLLERFLSQLNASREPISRITYNVVSNTQAAEYIKSMQGDTTCDCLLTISLCYGKQTVVAEERATRQSDNTDESAFSDEVLITTLNSQNTFWCTTWGSGTLSDWFSFSTPVHCILEGNENQTAQGPSSRIPAPWSLGRHQPKYLWTEARKRRKQRHCTSIAQRLTCKRWSRHTKRRTSQIIRNQSSPRKIREPINRSRSPRKVAFETARNERRPREPQEPPTTARTRAPREPSNPPPTHRARERPRSNTPQRNTRYRTDGHGHEIWTDNFSRSFVGRTPVANTINATNSINPNIITVNTGNKPISGLTSSGTVNSHRNSNSNNSITNSNANLPKQNGGMTLNRQNTRVEYAPDYRRVTNRWIRNADGSVTDLQPQWPWDSIYFHIFSPTFLATQRKRTLVIRLHFLHGLVNRQRLPFLHLRKNLKDLNLRADNGQSL